MNTAAPKMKIVLLVAVTICFRGFPQTFETAVDGYFFNADFPGSNIVIDEQGDFIVAGKTSPVEGLSSLVLAKYNKYGQRQWNNNYETGAYLDYHLSLHAMPGREYLIVASGPFLIRLIVTDSLGGRKWTKNISPGRYEGKNPLLVVSGSREFSLFGTRVLSAQENYMRVISYATFDTGGIISPEKQIRYFEHLTLQSAKQTSDGGFILSAYLGFPYNEGSILWLSKLDEQGDTVWTREFDQIINVKNSDVAQLSNNQYVITGTVMAGTSCRDRMFFLWLDGNGQRILYKELPGEMNRAYDVIQTFDKGFAFTGSATLGGNGREDLYLVKTNILGEVSWTNTFGGAYADVGYELRQTADSGFVIIGSTESYGGYDTYLLKTSKNGKVSCRLDHELFYEPLMYSVGTDYMTGKVLVAHEPVFGQAEILLYKESALPGSYILVKRQPVSEDGIVVDTTAIPTLRSYSYKIKVINECGETSLFSHTHGTIFLEVFTGASKTVNLYWNHYKGAEVETYVILRGGSEDDLVELDYLPGHINIYSDLYPSEGTVHYRIRALLAGTDEEVPLPSRSSLSNIASLYALNRSDVASADGLSIWPNPVGRVSRISYPDPEGAVCRFNLYDLTGRLIRSREGIKGGGFEFSRDGLPAGTYLIELVGPQTFRARVIVK